MHYTNWDYLIIGAGIVGITLARELNLRYPNAKIVILEKEKTLGLHASGRNSGVLHTGIYYPANTLKAKFCKEGADLLFNYAQEHQIPVRKDGKVIVATSVENARGLEQLLENAKANQICAEKIGPSEILTLEPYACSDFGGIYCKDTAVIDSQQVLSKLKNELSRNKINIIFNQTVSQINAEHNEVQTQNASYSYGMLINAAGSYADSIAKLVNIGLEYTLIPFKGIYYKLDPSVAHTVRTSIYPVPNPSLPFLGVHFTRVINGDVYVGPTAIPALGRENYTLFGGINAIESMSILKQLIKLYGRNEQGFRQLVKKEMSHYTRLGFINSAQCLMKELKPSWIKASRKVGIRPQLLNTKDMRLEMDFIIKPGKNSVHVLNSISPAFTSSFAVARHIVDGI
ncbi:L-2-hydroxyglutarate oxidase [bacterium]|nr:L-2-hydroxyglutarate oxidase [bacterium]